VYDEYIRQAALGEVMHNDDTSMRILRLAREPADARTGIFTSGIVSLGPGWKSPCTSAAPNMRERIWPSC
jgi:transposase